MLQFNINYSSPLAQVYKQSQYTVVNRIQQSSNYKPKQSLSSKYVLNQDKSELLYATSTQLIPNVNIQNETQNGVLSTEDKDQEKIVSARKPRGINRVKKSLLPKKVKKFKKSTKKKKQKQWDSLIHSGPLFPPEYEPHRVPIRYDGKQIILQPKSEEVATLYAAKLHIEAAYKEEMTNQRAQANVLCYCYYTSEIAHGSNAFHKLLSIHILHDKSTQNSDKCQTFRNNFWSDFKRILDQDGHDEIKTLDKIDFNLIQNHLEQDKEKRKNQSSTIKKQIKAWKDIYEEQFTYAVIDDKKEKVGNFRVEPPGLLMGRGDHPLMGKLKRRILPEDVTINIGSGVDIQCKQYPDRQWKEILHDQTVAWLARWQDPIDTSALKYVMLSPSSSIKALSDYEKFETARYLKQQMPKIQKQYQKFMQSKDRYTQQLGVIIYFLDQFAFRAGYERDEDEAQTVGCCTLLVKNVILNSSNQVIFDFLGKDSIQLYKEVTVEPQVHKLLKDFMEQDSKGNQKEEDQLLFDTINAQEVNKEIRKIVPPRGGKSISIKVFRTQKASSAFDEELWQDLGKKASLMEKKRHYDLANQKVAQLCNHQRATRSSSDARRAMTEKQIQRENDKKKKINKENRELQKQIDATRKNMEKLKFKKTIERNNIKLQKCNQKITSLQLQAETKEALSAFNLSTSKMNYCDPRITFSYCKRNNIPIKNMYNKTQQERFNWAFGTENDNYKF